MPDARTIIEGRVASDVRFGTTNSGKAVANLRVLAGRSRKNEQGEWETLSTTAYDIAFWEAHHDLVAGLGPQKGDSVTITGTILGVESYQGDRGESLSVKVSGDGLRVFPKQVWQSSGGYTQQRPQAGYGQQQSDPWQGGGGGGTAGGYADPPF